MPITKGEGVRSDVGRQTPAGGAHIFLGQPNIYFATVNAKDAHRWLANETVQVSLVELWKEEATAWRVGFYLLMPDHLHFFCAPHDLHFGIDQWIEFWKRQFSRRHLTRSWAWQRRSFHHRMRNLSEYEEKLTYVRENSIRKGLVLTPDGWPYQGVVHELRWTTG